MSGANDNHAHLLALEWDRSVITQWLKEDIPSMDYGGFVVGDKDEEAILYCKKTGVLAGSPFVTEIFTSLGCTVEWKIKEGTLIEADGKRIEVAVVRGQARKILVGERTALNLLARAAGIATEARYVSDLGKKHNFKGVIAGTRKTTPGFRIVEKYALLVGGCDQHRMDLSSMIMLKDNHIWSTGSITNAVKKAKSVGGFSVKIEVECSDKASAIEAIKAGADIVMLDNQTPQNLKAIAKDLKTEFPHVIIEASGGVTRDSIVDYFSEYVDVISMGNLTQELHHIDFSLKVKH
eukprot:TRINITY_DN692_c0_g1_i1.p1 TRINITY_DN692_c0_g1~~TRINITY_DN692_c0_g1_i1.p1  ORF type:complete len:293 (+),score=93.26 TRINITY_DN692_c0_g1_i1:61-939(+)